MEALLNFSLGHELLSASLLCRLSLLKLLIEFLESTCEFFSLLGFLEPVLNLRDQRLRLCLDRLTKVKAAKYALINWSVLATLRGRLTGNIPELGLILHCLLLATSYLI